MQLGLCVCVCANLEIFIRLSPIGIVFGDLDADDIISNCLQEEGSHHPQHVDDEIQKHSLCREKRIEHISFSACCGKQQKYSNIPRTFKMDLVLFDVILQTSVLL